MTDTTLVIGSTGNAGRPGGRPAEVTGPRALGFGEGGRRARRVTGRDVRYTPVTAERYREMPVEHGLPPEFGELFATILDGRNAEPADGAAAPPGRPATGFTAYARRTAVTGIRAG